MSPMHFIDQQRIHYHVQHLCQVLDVVPSRYYAWRHRQAAGTMGTSEPAWETEMLPVFDHHERRYGTRRLLEAQALASPDPISTLHFIDQQRYFHPVQQLCQVLGVVPSRYYA